MYFGSPLTGPFTVGGPSFTSHSVLKNKQNKNKEHFPAPLKPDAVLHSLKPQSTL